MENAPLFSADFKKIDEETIAGLPKVVLHDHLDGGLRPQTLIELAQEIGYDELPTQDPEALAQWFYQQANSGDLVEYLRGFAHTTAVMQTAPAITRIVREAAADLAADGVIYAELRFAPEQHTAAGLSLQEVVDAAVLGAQQAEAELLAADGSPQILVRLILCAMRQNQRSTEIAELTIANYGAASNGYVVGFDIAGPEAGFPPADHSAAFELLRQNFVPFTIHAGEAAGVDSLADALLQGTWRIGHGARLVEDFGVDEQQLELAAGKVSRFARDRRIALELCPTSNLQTGVVAELAEHPFELLQSLGFTCTVNTDNRLVSATTMSKEMMVLVENFGFGLAELREITLQAAGQAFISEPEREVLLAKIDAGYEQYTDPDFAPAAAEDEELPAETAEQLARLQAQYGITKDELEKVDPELLAELGIDADLLFGGGN